MRDKRQLIEWGKNALIVLLTASAVWLLTMTPLVQDSGLLDLLAPLAERAFVLRPDSPRAMDPAALCALLAERGVEARPCVSVEEGLNAALAVGEAICALGSLYLCGEVRSAWFKTH